MTVAEEDASTTTTTDPVAGSAGLAAEKPADGGDSESESDSEDTEFRPVSQPPPATQRLFASPPPSPPPPEEQQPSPLPVSPLAFTAASSPQLTKSAEDPPSTAAETTTSRTAMIRDTAPVAGTPLEEGPAATSTATAAAATRMPSAAVTKVTEARAVSPLLVDLCDDLSLLPPLNAPLNVTISMPQSGLGLADILGGKRQAQALLQPQPPPMKRSLALVTAVPLPGAETSGSSAGSGSSDDVGGGSSAGAEETETSKDWPKESAISAVPLPPSCEDSDENVSNRDDEVIEVNDTPDLDSVVLEELEGMPVLVTLDPDGGGPLDVSMLPSTGDVHDLSLPSGDVDNVSGESVEGAADEIIANDAGVPDLPMPSLEMGENDEGCRAEGCPMPVLAPEPDVASTLHDDLSISDADDDTSGAGEKLNLFLSPLGGTAVESTIPRRRVSRVASVVTDKKPVIIPDCTPCNVTRACSTPVSCQVSEPEEQNSASTATKAPAEDVSDEPPEDSNRVPDKEHVDCCSKEDQIDTVEVAEESREGHAAKNSANEGAAPVGWDAVGSRLSDDSEGEESPGPSVSMPLFSSTALKRSLESCDSSPERTDEAAKRGGRSSTRVDKSSKSLFFSRRGKKDDMEKTVVSLLDSPEKEKSGTPEDTIFASIILEKSVNTNISPKQASAAASMFDSPDETLPSLPSTSSSKPCSNGPPGGVGSMFDSPEKQNTPVLPTSAPSPAKSSSAPQVPPEVQRAAGTTHLPLETPTSETDVNVGAAEIQDETRTQPDTVPIPAFHTPGRVPSDPVPQRRRRKRRKDRWPPEWERRLSQPAEDQDVLDLLRNMTQLGDVLVPLPGVETMAAVMPLSPLSELTEKVVEEDVETSNEMPETMRTNELSEELNGAIQSELPDKEYVKMPFEETSNTGETEDGGEEQTKSLNEEKSDIQPIPEVLAGPEVPPEEDATTAEMKELTSSPGLRRPFLHLDSSGFEVSDNVGVGERPSPVAVLSPLAVTATAAAGTTLPLMLRTVSMEEPCAEEKGGKRDASESAMEGAKSREGLQETAKVATEDLQSVDNIREFLQESVNSVRCREIAVETAEAIGKVPQVCVDSKTEETAVRRQPAGGPDVPNSEADVAAEQVAQGTSTSYAPDEGELENSSTRPVEVHEPVTSVVDKLIKPTNTDESNEANNCSPGLRIRHGGSACGIGHQSGAHCPP